MAPIVLAAQAHCDRCAKKMRKALKKKVPGVVEACVSRETGLVVVEGTPDVAALVATLQAWTKNRPVTVVSDGSEAAAAGSGSCVPSPTPPFMTPQLSPEPAPTGSRRPLIVLEMDLHCVDCAKRVERRVKRKPGVETVTADLEARRVEITGTADASTVATYLEVSTGKHVRVVSDPASRGVPGYLHERRREVGQQQEEGHLRLPATTSRWRQRRRTDEPAPPASPVQPVGGYQPPYDQPGDYPEPVEGQYGVHNWGAPAYPPAPESAYYYPPPEEQYGFQNWGAPAYPPPESHSWGQGGESSYGYGQQWEAPSQHDMNNGPPNDFTEENPNCSIQ